MDDNQMVVDKSGFFYLKNTGYESGILAYLTNGGIHCINGIAYFKNQMCWIVLTVILIV